MSDTLTETQAVATCPQCGASVSLPGYADLAVCPYCGSGLRRSRPMATAEDGQAVEEQVLHAVSCPQCAGPLGVRAGRRILLCRYCGVRVLVGDRGGVSRWLFPQKVDRVQALAAARRWLADYPGVSRRARDVPLAQARLVHAPIWEHKALVAGWEFGTKLRTRYELEPDEQGGERLALDVVEEPFKEAHLKERRFFQAACDLQALGATRPRFSGRELLLPLVAGEVDASSTVMEVLGDSRDIAEQGRSISLRPASGAADPYARMLVLRESVSLLYYPLWIVDYRAEGKPFRIVVDGREGGVNSASAPAANRLVVTPTLGVRLAFLLAAAFAALWLAVAWESLRVPTVLIAVIVLVVVITLVLGSPRGGKVEFHEPFSS